MARAYLGVDLGTTSIKCMAVDEAGVRLYVASRVHETLSPREGWIEQDPDGWLAPAIEAIRECVAETAAYDVSAIALSGHMSSPVLLDGDLKPVYPCMTVGDARCEAQADRLLEDYGARFRDLTNNKPFACFAVAKLMWFRKQEPQKYADTKCFVFAKDYLRYQLTGVLNTDPTDAGNSLLYNRDEGGWDWELIEALGLKKEMFPRIVPSMDCVGSLLPEIARKCGLSQKVRVFCGGADMACSQIGTNSFSEDTLAITLSTSGQVCMRVTATCDEGYGKLTFHPGVIPGAEYAMGSIFSGGLALNWCYGLLDDCTKMTAQSFEKMNEMAARSRQYPPGSGGVIFLPFLTGSGSPYFSSTDRSTFLGISASTDRIMMFKAVMEGIAFHIRENVDVFRDMGCKIARIHLSGGVTNIKPWVQILTDILGTEIHLLECADASTLGAALIAVVGDDPKKQLKDVADRAVRTAGTMKPDAEHIAAYDGLYQVYTEFYHAVHGVYSRM